MKKLLLTLMLLPILSNCTQYSSLVGPSYTFVESGNILQSTTSLTSSLTMNSIKKNFIHEVKDLENGFLALIVEDITSYGYTMVVTTSNNFIKFISFIKFEIPLIIIKS